MSAREAVSFLGDGVDRGAQHASRGYGESGQAGGSTGLWTQESRAQPPSLAPKQAVLVGSAAHKIG